MTDQDEVQPFTPSLTEARMPSVDHMFNQGILNVILDRTLGGWPAKVPHERPQVGLFNNLVRLTDKALREYDAARFELIDYIEGRDVDRKTGVRTSPYIRAIDHMENVISALVRGINCRDSLQSFGVGRDAPRILPALRDDVVRLRDMIEHTDERLTKQSIRPSRRQFGDNEPYALRLENDFAFMGDWRIDFVDVVAAIAVLYQFIEHVREVPSAGQSHPQAVTRTSVTYIGDAPQRDQVMFATDLLWEVSRHSVSH